MSFYDRLDLIDIEIIKEALNNGISNNKMFFESELMRIAFNDKNILNCDSLTLYQNHFVLFYLLYKLQEEYFQQNKYLHVHFMRTKLNDYPKKNRCRFYDEHNGKFCNVESKEDKYYCEFHEKKIGVSEIEELSTKYFYFDIDNYYKLDKETADAFINGTWEVLANFDKVRNCFVTLELPEVYDIELIKKQFKVLAKKYHPDMGEQSHQKFNEINRAYRFLIQTIPYMKQ